MRKLFGYTWVGWLNMLFLQWLFVRVFYETNNMGHIVCCGILFPIVPLTGWWQGFIPQMFFRVRIPFSWLTVRDYWK